MRIKKNMRQLRKNFFFSPRQGFTLIEMLLVLFALILLAQFSLYAFPQSSVQEQIERELEQISDTLLVSQQYAITHQQIVTVSFYKKTGFYRSENLRTKAVIAAHTHKLLESVRAEEVFQIQITNQGTFSKSGSYYFRTPNGSYRLVVLVGQGRFYYEKI